MLRLLAMVGLIAVEISGLPGAPATEPDAATIIDSGSTNRPGFRIVVDRSGIVKLTSTPRRLGAQQARPAPIRRMLPHALVEAFYSDIEAAKPLDLLPSVHCAKSVSFGTTLTVVFGKQTPDLSCGDGGNAAMRDLIRDTRQIVALIQAKETGDFLLRHFRRATPFDTLIIVIILVAGQGMISRSQHTARA
jgi:hypothetical protein